MKTLCKILVISIINGIPFPPAHFTVLITRQKLFQDQSFFLFHMNKTGKSCKKRVLIFVLVFCTLWIS